MTITLHEPTSAPSCWLPAAAAACWCKLDWDFPGLASTFGWTPCPCGTTDGTIDCEHRTAGEMIAEAHDFLRAARWRYDRRPWVLLRLRPGLCLTAGAFFRESHRADDSLAHIPP